MIGTELVINKWKSVAKETKKRFRWIIADYNADRQVMKKLSSEYWFKTEEDAKKNAEALSTFPQNWHGYS